MANKDLNHLKLVLVERGEAAGWRGGGGGRGAGGGSGGGGGRAMLFQSRYGWLGLQSYGTK